MTKYLAWIGLGLLALWLIKATGLVAAVALFLMAGIVPGVEVSIPPIPMLILLAAALFVTIIWIKQQRLGRQLRELKAHHAAKTAAPQPKKRSTRPRARYSRPKAVTR